SITIGDPQAIIERSFDFVGENAKQLKGDNKYWIYVKKTVATGELSTADDYDADLSTRAPAEDPNTADKYMQRIIRIRSGSSDELTSSDYSYVASSTTLTISNAQVGDVYKIFYTSATAPATIFSLNDSDPAGIIADSAEIYLYIPASAEQAGSSDYVYRLQSITLDVSFEIEDLREVGEDIKEDLREELEELKEERNTLLDEIGDMKGDLENLGENTKERIEHARNNMESLRDRVSKHGAKYGAQIKKKLEKAKKKAAKRINKRINISVDPETSNEWRGWSDQLGKSVSELVRKSMKFVKNNIGDIAKLEAWGRDMEKVGENIESAVSESGLEDLGEKLESKFGKAKIKPKIKMKIPQKTDIERVKKRVRGLIKLQKSIPIEKLANALNTSNNDAENLIYELVDEGIEGDLEEGVFKFTSTPEDVINKLNSLIDKM
ncbi:hypothetical protein LCGC14_1403880, partial [marine sediment metagenome]